MKRNTCSGSIPYNICSPIILGWGSSSFMRSGSYLTNSTKLKDSSSISPYPKVDQFAYDNSIASHLSPYHGFGSYNCNNYYTGSISRNSYNNSGSYTSSICQSSSVKKGHKVVQAVKQWHGRTGFICGVDECNAIDNRYLTVTRHTNYREGYFTGASGSYTGSLTVTFNATSERSYTVDRYSGAITMGSCYDSASVGTWDVTKAAIVQNSYNGLAMGMGCYDSASRAAMNYDYSIPAYGYIEYQSCSISDTNIALHFETNYSNDYQEHITNITLGGAYSSSAVYADAVNILNYLSLNDDDAVPFSTFGYRGFGALLTLDEAPGPVNPDFGITDCTMYNGILYTGSGSQPADWEATHQSGWWETGYTTGSKNCNYSGEILGIIYTGSGRVSSSFDFNHITYRYTTVDGGLTYNWFPTYYGAWSSQNIVGYETLDGIAHSKWTQWTNNFNACYLPKGAYIIVPQGAGSIMLQKYLEIKEPLQSYNFSRPCGYDRFQPDIPSGSCIGSWYSYPDIYTNTDLTPYLSAGDYIYVDSGSISRISIVDAVYSDHITEGYKIFTDESLLSSIRPRNFIAPLRYYPDKFRNVGICGRKNYYINKEINHDGLPITCSSADNNNHYLIDSDVIYAYSKPTSYTNAGYYTVNRVNSQSFALQGTSYISALSLYNYSFYVCHSSSLGVDASTLDYYNDNTSKGDIVFVNAEPCYPSTPNSGCQCVSLGEDGINLLGRYSSSISGSSYGLSWTGSCVKYQSCGAYMGCSPNNDFPAYTTTASFRNMFRPSSCGSQWSNVAVQHVVDPLYQSSSICNTVAGDCSQYVEPIINTASIYMPEMPPDTYFNIPISGAVGLGKGAASMPNYETPTAWYLDSCLPQPI